MVVQKENGGQQARYKHFKAEKRERNRVDKYKGLIKKKRKGFPGSRNTKSSSSTPLPSTSTATNDVMNDDNITAAHEMETMFQSWKRNKVVKSPSLL